MDEAKAFGVVIGPRFAQNADTFNDNLERLQFRLKGIALTIADALLPALIDLTERLLGIGDSRPGFFDDLALDMEIFLRNAANVTSSWDAYWEAFWNPGDALAKAASEVMAEREALNDALKPVKPAIDPDDVRRAEDMLQRIRSSTNQLFPGELISVTTGKGDKARTGFAPAGDVQAEDLRFKKQMEQISLLAIEKQQKDTLVQEEEELHQATLDAIKSRYHQKEQDRILAEEESRRRVWQASLQIGSDFFGALASIAVLFGKKGFAAYKAFAIAQAIMDTIRGAQAAYASAAAIPFAGPVLAPIAAGVAVVAGTARVAQIAATNPSGYMAGGYTGSGRDSDVAGVVHRNEYVMPAPATKRLGISTLDAIAAGDVSSASATPVNVHVIHVNDGAELREQLKRSSIAGAIIEIVRNNKLALGMA